MKTMTHEQFLTEAKSRFGADVRQWKFICPMCGTVQSVKQLSDAVIANGGKNEDVEKYVGFSCIGRFTGQDDSGIKAKSQGKSWDKGCNWTLGGLLKCHDLEVVMSDGRKRPTFELAEIEHHETKPPLLASP